MIAVCTWIYIEYSFRVDERANRETTMKNWRWITICMSTGTNSIFVCLVRDLSIPSNLAREIMPLWWRIFANRCCAVEFSRRNTSMTRSSNCWRSCGKWSNLRTRTPPRSNTGTSASTMTQATWRPLDEPRHRAAVALRPSIRRGWRGDSHHGVRVKPTS